MFVFDLTFFWTLLNLFILYLVLRKYLFRRVNEMLEKRTESVSSSLEDARNRMEEAQRTQEEARATLAEAREESARILEEARMNGRQIYDDIVKTARTDAADLIRKTTEAMEIDRARMARDMYDQVVRLSLAAASKVVEQNLDTVRNRELVDRILNEEGNT
ncbi:MAG TPA: ATP synthase F0 subunit B [Clostridiales bacterium]|nr:ATP synthase F0 subunit B [Clostridiales bacterium]